MISFYPGPSRVHDEIPAYVKDAFREGIMSVNHRSDVFIAMSKRTIALLKQKLGIPSSYTVFFTSSATECWEIIAQSLVHEKSLHLYNGAFGQKWFEYTKKLHAASQSFPFNVNDPVAADKHIFPGKDDVICVTQNETSNGTQVTNSLLRKIRKNNPSHLVAVDATSSMAGIHLDFRAADIWFASVQKCFGLPAGLGIMVCSPAALDRAAGLGEKKHYNSLTFMMSMMEKWQTPYTPNVLGIYLLMRVLEKMEPVRETEKRIIRQYHQWVAFLGQRKMISHFVTNDKVHSFTVIPVMADEKTLASIKKGAKRQGLLLGEGYGEFKPHTFRIANFPAIREKEIRQLKKFLQSW
jgi:phosphoserine aminotransferase